MTEKHQCEALSVVTRRRCTTTEDVQPIALDARLVRVCHPHRHALLDGTYEVELVAESTPAAAAAE